MTIHPDTLEQYRRTLRYKVWYHLGGLCPDVDDIVQETMTRFLQAFRDEKIRKPEHAGAFLSGICNNVIQEYRRRKWKEPLRHANLSRPERAATAESDPVELRQVIIFAMSRLSQRDRSILCAFYLEEQTKEDICRTIGLSAPEFRVALFRAKERFRKSYHETVKQNSSNQH